MMMMMKVHAVLQSVIAMPHHERHGSRVLMTMSSSCYSRRKKYKRIVKMIREMIPNQTYAKM
jgi:hypothetical protein